eukprot:5341011-Prymnesium_polylepis.1
MRGGVRPPRRRRPRRIPRRAAIYRSPYDAHVARRRRKVPPREVEAMWQSPARRHRGHRGSQQNSFQPTVFGFVFCHLFKSTTHRKRNLAEKTKRAAAA